MLVLAALWGASFLFMRVAVPALGPVVLADARVAIAGAALSRSPRRSARWPRSRGRWRDCLLLGAVNAALPFALLSAASWRSRPRSPRCSTRWRRCAARWSPRSGSASGSRRARGRARARRRGRRARRRPLAVRRSTAAFVAAVVACLAAAFAYGVGANLVRVRFAGEPPLALAIGQQLAAAVVLLPLIPLCRSARRRTPSTRLPARAWRSPPPASPTSSTSGSSPSSARPAA